MIDLIFSNQRLIPGVRIGFESKNSCLHQHGCLHEPTMIFFKVIWRHQKQPCFLIPGSLFLNHQNQFRLDHPDPIRHRGNHFPFPPPVLLHLKKKGGTGFLFHLNKILGLVTTYQYPEPKVIHTIFHQDLFFKIFHVLGFIYGIILLLDG